MPGRKDSQNGWAKYHFLKWTQAFWSLYSNRFNTNMQRFPKLLAQDMNDLKVCYSPVPSQVSWWPALHFWGLIHRCGLRVLHHRILGGTHSWWHHCTGRTGYPTKGWIWLLSHPLQKKRRKKKNLQCSNATSDYWLSIVILGYFLKVGRGEKSKTQSATGCCLPVILLTKMPTGVRDLLQRNTLSRSLEGQLLPWAFYTKGTHVTQLTSLCPSLEGRRAVVPAGRGAL